MVYILVELYKELCVVVSYTLLQAVSWAMYSASDICMRVFSAKEKYIDMLRGEVWTPKDIFCD